MQWNRTHLRLIYYILPHLPTTSVISQSFYNNKGLGPTDTKKPFKCSVLQSQGSRGCIRGAERLNIHALACQPSRQHGCMC